MLVLYPLSYGPALYVAVKADPFLTQANQYRVEECYTVLYFPILVVEQNCPDWMSQPVKAYHHWWIELARGR